MSRPTQKAIAERVGIDVSSVNKILNRMPGPVFAKETIERVERVAKRMGWEERASKGWKASLIAELFPRDWTAEQTARARGLSLERVKEIRATLYDEKVA